MATTKIKKVETPIDERETFVSLQKSFADSEANIQEKLQVLYELQAADNEIEKIVQLRGELPEEVANLEAEVAGMEAKIAQLEDLITEYTNGIESNKQNIVELDAQIAKYKAQLENIANSREFDSISKEIENQELLRMIADKNINEARFAIENKKGQIEDINKRIAVRNEDLAAKKEELTVIIGSTSSDEEKLQARRAALAAKVDARTMSAYDRIRSSVHNHLAVVSVFNGNSCGGCFNTITPQRLIDIASGNKLVICEHCGRIIVNPSVEG